MVQKNDKEIKVGKRNYGEKLFIYFNWVFFKRNFPNILKQDIYSRSKMTEALTS